MHHPAAPHHRLVVASWNIHKCVGTDGRFAPERIAAVIGEIGPDIMALQEVDTRFGERRGLLDLGHLERSTGLVPVPLPPGRAAHGWHGNLILFRPDRLAGGHVRDVRPIDLPGLEPRGALIAEFHLETASPLRVIAAHLGLLRTSRRRQALSLLDLLQSADAMPTVLMGDLNEWRLGKTSGLKHLADAFGTDETHPSFPSRMPVFALDRIMGNRPGLVGAMRVHRTALSRIASDHLPLTAELTLPLAR